MIKETKSSLMLRAANALDLNTDGFNPWQVLPYLSAYWEQIMESGKLNDFTIDELTHLSKLVNEWENNANDEGRTE